jgi:hypothetical protein
MSARLSSRLNSIKTLVTRTLQLRARSNAIATLLLLTFFLPAGVRAQTPGTFSQTGSMKEARVGFTATLLLTGKVLVAGGANSPQVAAKKTAELYDPTTRTFAYTGSMTAARTQHAAALLPDGKVLITGGVNEQGAGNASAELYDPASGTFAPTGSMIIPYALHTTTLLVTGKVLIAGGGTQIELYDPATGKFSNTETTDNVPFLSDATPLADGNVFFSAGEDEPAQTGELYDFGSNAFLPPVNLTSLHDHGSGTLLLDGQVLVAGGGLFPFNPIGDGSVNTDLFTPADNGVTAGPPMTTPRALQAASLLADGQVLLAGGYNAPPGPNFISGPPTFLSSAELFDPVQNRFTPTGAMLTARVSPAVGLSNGKVLVLGGGTNDITLSEAELYTPPSMPVIKIVSPLNNSIALLGSPRIIYTRIGSNVSWVNVYIDGKHLKSSPPFQFVWTPATTGAHQISVMAYNCSNKPIGTDAVTVDVQP